MALFDPFVPDVPTAVGRVGLQVYSAPLEEGGLEYGGRLGFVVLDAQGNVVEERRANLQADDLTTQQKQTLRDLLDTLRASAEGTLP